MNSNCKFKIYAFCKHFICIMKIELYIPCTNQLKKITQKTEIKEFKGKIKSVLWQIRSFHKTQGFVCY